MDKIRIRTTRATKLHVGWPYEPKSMTTAQMNLPFCVAALLHDRDFFVDQVTEKSIRSDAVLQTTRTIEVLEDPELEALGDEGRHGVNLEVQLQDGRSYSEKVLHAKGSDKHPMTREEVLQKFRLRHLASSHALALRSSKTPCSTSRSSAMQEKLAGSHGLIDQLRLES